MTRRSRSILAHLIVLLVLTCHAACAPAPPEEKAPPAERSEEVFADGFEEGEPTTWEKEPQEDPEDEEEQDGQEGGGEVE